MVSSVIPVQEAFDRHAPQYDLAFAAGELRSRVWQFADTLFKAGDNILDIGCGTGEDAFHFAGRGISVTAIDLSPRMIEQLRSKSIGSITCQVADMRTFRAAESLDGIFSNFGALNCV